MTLCATANAATYSLIIAGLGGEPDYEQRFREQADQLALAAHSLTGDESSVRVLSGRDADRESVRRELRALAAKAGPDDQVIVTFIGHGTFDGESYRFNLPGPDLTAAELGSLLDQLRARQQLIVNATSASGAVLESWKSEQRIVITATRSGSERTATRFTSEWIQALRESASDTNKDDIVTATEAYDYALRRVADSYKSEALLATEHARLDGAGAGQFQVARLGPAARVTTDSAMNDMYAQRVRIEREIDAVKERKTGLAADAYYDELEGVLVRLAQLQRQIDAKVTQ
ncbi:MAG TPA: C13 family peptidase [Povalibacter sp.]